MMEFLKKLLVCVYTIAFYALVVFGVSYIINYVRWILKGYKRFKTKKGVYKQHNILVKLFIDLPKAMAFDRLTYDPETFDKYGLHMVCGKQGRGKTMTVVYLLRKWKKLFPKCKILTNMDYKYEDAQLKHWEQLTLDTNGIYGEIDVIDEIQNWFSSARSSSFPTDFLQIVTQQRKVRRCIIGTSQVFSRISKPLREQTQYLYMPLTFFGCFTVCRVYEVEIDNNGDLKSKTCRQTFCYVHDKELRESYNSYKIVENMRKAPPTPLTPTTTTAEKPLLQEL